MSTDLKSRFVEFYNDLQYHPIFKEMRQTVEDSPWHREANVAIHTDMVVAEYIARSPEMWNEADMVGAVACAFHDFGKPAAEETVWREDRGNYRRYTGHEKMSARIFETWAAVNYDRFVSLGLAPNHLTQIAWLVEHHLPWGIKKPLKREAIARTAMSIGEGILERVLLSDTWGRISDDAETKQANALAWVEEFQIYKNSLPVKTELSEDAPLLLVAIGSPGCGKSTFRDSLNDDILIHNMDELRCEWYLDESHNRDVDYDIAYRRSTEDKTFASRVHQTFIKMVKTGKDIYCDNTNASAKRRAFYVTEARKKGYKIVAVLFPVSLNEVINRQATRTDKTVPTQAVIQLYNAIQMPQLGEFDEIQTISSNLV